MIILLVIWKNEIDFSLITETWLKKVSSLKGKLGCPSICSNDKRGMVGTGIWFNQERNKIGLNTVTKDDVNRWYSIAESGNLLIVVTYLSLAMGF